MGRRLVAAGIGFYRRFLRPWYRRDCLFRVTCSEHVLRAGGSAGLSGAWIAFTDRFARCRAGFSIGTHQGLPCAVTESGVPLPLQELSDEVQAEVLAAFQAAGVRD